MLFHDRAWVVVAFLTLAFFAGSNFLSGVIGKQAENPHKAGLSNGQVQLLADGSIGVLAGVLMAIRGGIHEMIADYRTSGALVFSGAVLATAVLVLAFALATDFRMGPFITGVLPFNSVFLVFGCRILLGEQTTMNLAITVAVVGLAVMATADFSAQGVQGIGYGMIAALCFAIGNFGIKYASLRGIGHLPSVSLLLLGQGALGLVFFLVQSCVNKGMLTGLDRLNSEWGGMASSRLAWFSALSGLLQAGGVIFMKLAVSLGPAAPAMAIANANAIGVLVLNEIFFQPKTNAQQIIGLFICIAGIGMLSIAPKSTAEAPLSTQVADAGEYDGHRESEKETSGDYIKENDVGASRHSKSGDGGQNGGDYKALHDDHMI